MKYNQNDTNNSKYFNDYQVITRQNTKDFSHTDIQTNIKTINQTGNQPGSQSNNQTNIQIKKCVSCKNNKASYGKIKCEKCSKRKVPNIYPPFGSKQAELIVKAISTKKTPDNMYNCAIVYGQSITSQNCSTCSGTPITENRSGLVGPW